MNIQILGNSVLIFDTNSSITAILWLRQGALIDNVCRFRYNVGTYMNKLCLKIKTVCHKYF